MTAELVSRRQRHRVHLLGDLLGETMLAKHGSDFLDKIEQIRQLAKTRRQNQQRDDVLLNTLRELEDELLVSVARAFHQFINLTNIAEQAETTELRLTPFPDASELASLFQSLAGNIDSERTYNAVSTLCIDIVLTAHPTEVTRRTLIQKYNRIAAELQQVHEDQPLRAEQRRALERLIAEVWYTDEIRDEIPTPEDEAKWGYAVVETSLWRAIPILWQGLDRLVFAHTDHHLPLDFSPIRVSSWMGGDRVGNTAVTASVTRRALRLARWAAADLYLRDIEELLRQLSMSECSPALSEMLSEPSSEPYRAVLRDIRDRLEQTRQWAGTDEPANDALILYKNELATPLTVCYQSLVDCGMGIIAEGLMRETLIRISTFGVTLVSLDIREHASRHEALLDALTQFLELGSYRDWSEKTRQAFILRELDSPRPLIPDDWQPAPSERETLATFRLIAEIGAEGISCYIVSMAKNPSDILAVILLLRKCGLARVIPVVPMFETLDDLENAAWTLERLFHLPWYLRHIDGRQQVLISYSDSARDGGQLTAAWAQYRAQEDLVSLCEKYKIELTMFHGRGSAVGQEGSGSRQATLALPPGTINSGMRVTEQGEVVRLKYGSSPQAIRHLDMMMAATLQARLLPPSKPRDAWRHLMDRLASVAGADYLATRANPDFDSYLSQSTPQEELSRLVLGEEGIGSGHGSIASLRTVPWIFAWTQKRLMLPAWLGTDTAIADGLSGRDAYVLREMANDWPFFRSMLDILELILSKADADICGYYDEQLLDSNLTDLGNELRGRLGGLIQSLNALKGQSTLLASAPELRRMLDLRNPYADPLHFMQIELMTRFRHASVRDIHVDKALLVTIAGIAASVRNVG